MKGAELVKSDFWFTSLLPIVEVQRNSTSFVRCQLFSRLTALFIAVVLIAETGRHFVTGAIKVLSAVVLRANLQRAYAQMIISARCAKSLLVDTPFVLYDPSTAASCYIQRGLYSSPYAFDRLRAFVWEHRVAFALSAAAVIIMAIGLKLSPKLSPIVSEGPKPASTPPPSNPVSFAADTSSSGINEQQLAKAQDGQRAFSAIEQKLRDQIALRDGHVRELVEERSRLFDGWTACDEARLKVQEEAIQQHNGAVDCHTQYQKVTSIVSELNDRLVLTTALCAGLALHPLMSIVQIIRARCFRCCAKTVKPQSKGGSVQNRQGQSLATPHQLPEPSTTTMNVVSTAAITPTTALAVSGERPSVIVDHTRTREEARLVLEGILFDATDESIAQQIRRYLSKLQKIEIDMSAFRVGLRTIIDSKRSTLPSELRNLVNTLRSMEGLPLILN